MNTSHPRFVQRLQTIGAALFVAGLTTHFGHYQSLTIAGIFLTIILLVRLSIEFSIDEAEPDQTLARKMQQLSFLNQFSMLIAVFGVMGFMREQ